MVKKFIQKALAGSKDKGHLREIARQHGALNEDGTISKSKMDKVYPHLSSHSKREYNFYKYVLSRVKR